jgi:tetratricopeptide (TPR) repeat protein
MSDDVTAEVSQDELLDEVDPIEEAWLLQEPDKVEAFAKERLEKDPNDFQSQAWLGLAYSITNRYPAGQAAIKKAFDLIRARLAATQDEEEKHILEWELHGIANRLVDTLAENPTLGVQSATWVVDALKLEHAPSLRLLSEDVGIRDGDPGRAAQFLKRALAVDGSDPESHYLAARLMARLGKKPQVLSHLQKAIDNAAGTIAVRTLSRFEPDFDGFRKDPEFAALVDLLPPDPLLRPIYQALDGQEFQKVVDLCGAAFAKAPNQLDVLYPWREALELLIDKASEGGPLHKELERIQGVIDEHEGKDEESAVYSRFCGDA